MCGLDTHSLNSVQKQIPSGFVNCCHLKRGDVSKWPAVVGLFLLLKVKITVKFLEPQPPPPYPYEEERLLDERHGLNPAANEEDNESEAASRKSTREQILQDG